MKIITKSFALPKSIYIKIGLLNTFKQYKLRIIVPLLVISCILAIIFKYWIIFSIILVSSILCILYWYLQFYIATKLPQNATMFQKLYYEISDRQITLFLRPNYGANIQWNMVKNIWKYKNDYVLVMSRVQFFYFPLSIFKTPVDYELFETIILRKNNKKSI